MGTKGFIRDFLGRSGGLVFSSLVVAKIIGFIISIYVANQLTETEFGYYTYAFSIVSFLIPFLGFGSYQSLVYFGAELKTEEEKQALFSYAFKRGLAFSAVMAIVLVLISGLVTQNLPQSQFLLIVLSMHIITFTLISFVRNYARLINRNDLFGRSEIGYNLILLSLVVTGVYFLKETGYAMAMALAPLIVGIYYFRKLKIPSFPNGKLDKQKVNKFWRYGIFVSLGAVAAQLLYAVDILTIGNFLPPLSAEELNELKTTGQGILSNTGELELNAQLNHVSKQIAIYKICSIIPLATFVLPLAIVTTDFVHIAEKKADKAFLKSYIKNLWKVLIPASLLIAGILHFGSTQILMLFDLWSNQPKYAGNETLISVFSLGVIGAFILRVPFGNLLSALGRADWNSYISFAMLGINVVLNYLLVSMYGIIGAAWATTIIIWVSGVVSYLVFKRYSKLS